MSDSKKNNDALEEFGLLKRSKPAVTLLPQTNPPKIKFNGITVENYTLEFTETIIAGMARMTINTVSKALFRARGLAAPSESDRLLIEQIYVGQLSQLHYPLPMKDLNAYSKNKAWVLDACESGMSISVQVSNPTMFPQKFKMTAIGKAIV